MITRTPGKPALVVEMQRVFERGIVFRITHQNVPDYVSFAHNSILFRHDPALLGGYIYDESTIQLLGDGERREGQTQGNLYRECRSTDDRERLIKRINEAVAEFNKKYGEPETVTVSGWINVYASGSWAYAGDVFPTDEAAKVASSKATSCLGQIHLDNVEVTR